MTAEVFLSKVTAAAAGPEHSSRAESLLRTALALEEELGIVDFEAGTCELLGSLLNRDGGTEEGTGCWSGRWSCTTFWPTGVLRRYGLVSAGRLSSGDRSGPCRPR